MQPLNEIHSRRLFFKRVFGTEDSCPEQFIEISHGMLRKCKGVPLAITSIASLLANHMHVEIWEKIHNSLGSELYTNPTLEWMRLEIQLALGQGAMELQEGSLVGGIKDLASLEKISLYICAKCGQGSKIESAWRDAISRHPKSQALQIYVNCREFDENGKLV
jgi:hypothetical protein